MWVKEVRCKRVHWCEIQGETVVICADRKKESWHRGEGVRSTVMGHDVDGNVLNFNLTGGYMEVFNCQNLSNYT